MATVTACDRCGTLPIECVLEEQHPVDRNSEGPAKYRVLFSIVGHRREAPDLCKGCFRTLIKEAIDEIVAQEIKEATRA